MNRPMVLAPGPLCVLQVHQLPMAAVGSFGALLEVLEAGKEELGIGHIGLSMPSLV